MVSNLINLIDESFSKLISHNESLPIQLDITNSCNLSCKHCYHQDHKNDGNLSINSWYKVIDDYFNLVKKLKYQPLFIICGGEPLLSPNLLPIIQKIKEKNKDTKIKILSNGTVVKDEFLNFISEHTDIAFQISLDGYDAKTHNFYRGTNSFEKTIQNIKRLVEKNFEVSILTVLSINTKKHIDKYFELAKQLKVNSCNFTRLIPEGFGKKMVQNNIDKPLLGIELRDAYISIVQNAIKYQINTDLNKPLMNLIIPGLGRNSKFWESIIIDYKGNILLSSRSRVAIGNVLIDDVENVFKTNTTLRSLRSGNIETCGTCSDYLSCGGDRNSAYAVYGSFLSKDPGCWKYITQEGPNEKTS